MSYNYERQFFGLKKLNEQPLCKVGELTCQYTGQVFSKPIVELYNHYTRDFNRSTWRAEQEFLLDQRHKFLHGMMFENLNQTDSISESPSNHLTPS